MTKSQGMSAVKANTNRYFLGKQNAGKMGLHRAKLYEAFDRIGQKQKPFRCGNCVSIFFDSH